MTAPARDALRIVLPIVLLSSGWVVLSYFPRSATLANPLSWLASESLLGLLAATGGGLLLFLLLRREFAQRDDAQRAQAVSGEQFRVLFNDSPDAIGLTALEDGRILEVNPRYCALFGRTRGELVGHTVLELGLWADPGDRTKLAAVLREHGRVVDFPTRFQARDGSIRHIRISAELVQLEGRPVIVGINRDVTERVATEGALRESDERYRDLVDNAPTGIFINADNQFAYVNAAFCRIVGASSPEQLLGKPVFDRYQPEFHEAIRKRIAHLLETGESVPLMDQRYVRMDGTLVDVEATATPITYEGRRAFQVLVNDITARKQAEAVVACQTKVLESVARDAPLAATLTTLLQSIESFAPGMVCSVVLLDEDGVHIRHGAAPSLPDAFNRAIEGQPIGPRAGSCGTAAFRREPVIVEDIATDPLWEDYRELALAHGLRACWSTPIFDAQQRVLGTFAIYYCEPGLPTPLHRRCIELGTHLAAVAMGKHRDDVRRRLVEQRQAAFAALGRRLASATDVTEAARIIAFTADDLLGWDSCKLDLYDESADRCRSILTMDIVNGQRQEVPPAYVDTPPSPRLRRSLEGVAELILRKPPLAMTPDRMPFGDVGRPSASLMSVPVREGGRVTGALAIHSYRLHAYTNEDLAVLQDLADHCAGALQRIGTQAALRTSEEFNRRLIDSSQDCIKVLDLDGKLLSMSTGGQRLLEIKDIARYLNSCWISFWQPEDQARVREAVDAAIAGGAGRFQAFCRTAMGSSRWWDVIITPIFGLDGKVERLLSVSRDVTAEHETGAELHRSQRRQAAFATLGRKLNATTDTVEAARVIVDIADDLFGWDSCTLDLYDAQTGKSDPVLNVDVINGQRQDVAPAYQDAPPSPRMLRAIEQGAELILRAEPLLLTPGMVPFGDTSRPSASIMIVPVREDGQVVGVLSIQSYRLNAYTNEDLAALQDLADHCAGALERIRGRTELERQRAELELILDTVPGIIFHKDRNHRLVRVNEAHARALGMPRAAIEGHTDAELGSPHSEQHIRDDDEVMRTGQPKLGIIEPMHTIAGTRWLQTDKLPYRDERGNIIGVLGFALDITERRQAEEALERQHALLSAVVEGTSDAVFAKDLEGRYLVINTAGARALGRPVNEVIGRTDVKLIPPEAARRFRQTDEEVVASGQMQMQEEMAVLPQGTRYFLANKAPWRDKDGNIIGIIGVARDITDRKQAEAEQARLWGVIEASLNEIYVFDAHSLRFEYVNAAALRNLGHSAEAMRTLTPIDLKPEFTAASFGELVEPLRQRTRDKIVFQTRHRRADGSLYPVEVHLQLVERGDSAVFLAVINDITERQRTELERQKFAQLANSSSEFIGMCDLDMQPLYVNPAGVRMVGLPDMAAACRVKVQDYFFPEDQRFIAEEFFPRVLREGHGDVEIRLRHFQTGEPIWMFYYLFCVRDESGTAVGWATVSRDITERKQSEAALRQSEERFAKAFDASPAAVNIATVHDGRLLNVNERFCQFFGYTREEVIGRTVSELGMWEDPAQRAPLKSLLQTNRSVRDFEARLRRKDGAVRDALISVEIIDYPGVSEPVLISMSTDITERKQAEQQLAESGELLRALLARLRLAREEERIRVAREIHDELGQLLTGLKMDVRWLERKLSEPGLPPTLNPLLDRAVAASELADTTIATVQKIASELRSGALAQLGLEAALTQEAR
ncbi:MAG: PAS domain S-box protein, partial [Limisphaerales bacterium]